jgi:hypothetical protein
MEKVTLSPAKLHVADSAAQRRSPSKASGHPQQPSTEALVTDTKQQAGLRRGLRWLVVVSALAATALLYPSGRILRHRAPVSAAAPITSGDVFHGVCHSRTAHTSEAGHQVELTDSMTHNVHMCGAGCNPQLRGFVFATTTNSQRHELIKASRGHRQVKWHAQCILSGRLG